MRSSKSALLHINKQKLQDTLDNKKELNEFISQQLSDQYKNLAKMEITPPIPLERDVPNDRGWVVHDFKYSKKKSVANIKLESLYFHEERLMKIKKIQYGNKYSERDLKLIVKQDLKKRPSSVINSQ